jgi:hypothetical protein
MIFYLDQFGQCQKNQILFKIFSRFLVFASGRFLNPKFHY